MHAPVARCTHALNTPQQLRGPAHPSPYAACHRVQAAAAHVARAFPRSGRDETFDFDHVERYACAGPFGCAEQGHRPSVTLTTQCSLDRWDAVQRQALAWDGLVRIAHACACACVWYGQNTHMPLPLFVYGMPWLLPVYGMPLLLPDPRSRTLLVPPRMTMRNSCAVLHPCKF